jgi:hypothetical protein
MTDAKRTCSFDGCEKPRKAKGLCSGHWRQQHRGADLSQLANRNTVVDGLKFCAGCEQTLPVERFGKKHHYHTELCKLCRNIKSRSVTYGISIDEVRALLARPCDVCGDAMTSLKTHHIDHCHDTGKVRGVLCHGCNTALGLVREDTQVLRALISYIERNI